MTEYIVKMGTIGAANAYKAKPTKGMSQAAFDAAVARARKMATDYVAKAMIKAVTPAPQPSHTDTIGKLVGSYCNDAMPVGAIKTTSNALLDGAVALGRVNPIPLVAAALEAAAQPKPHPDDVRERAVRIARQRNDVPGPDDIVQAGRQLRNQKQ